MTTRLPATMAGDTPVFTVTVAARLAGMHPQTLRQYDRLGLVVPQRTRGRGRRYSPNDVRRLRLVQHLSQAEGVNLQGIQRILGLEDELVAMRAQVTHLSGIIADLRWSMGTQGPRVFTADAHGGVTPGAHARRAPQLPSA